jgi:hypothetical protein
MFEVQPGGNTHFVAAVYHGPERLVIPGAFDDDPMRFFGLPDRGSGPINY